MSALRKFVSPAATTISDAICSAVGADQLDNYVRLLWRSYGEGRIGDDAAQVLQPFIDRRRPPTLPQAAAKVSAGQGPTSRRFMAPACRKRLPDKESRKRRERKRTLGGSGSMPAELRGRFTEGESAELCVIAGEVKRCGACDFVIEIADRWGRQDNGAKRYHSVKGGGMMWGRANGGLHRLGSLGNESFEGLLSTPSRRPPTRDSERGCV